jgi:hypothetical protein
VDILVRHGGEAVHVHEIALAKRPEHLPLESLRPDPWVMNGSGSIAS